MSERNEPWVTALHGPYPDTPTRFKTPAPIEGMEPSLVYYQDRIVFWHKHPNRKARRQQRRRERGLAVTK